MRDRRKDAAYWREAEPAFQEDLAYVRKSLAEKLQRGDPKAGIAAASSFNVTFEIILLDYSMGKSLDGIAADARTLLCQTLPDYLAKYPPGNALSIDRPGIDRINRYFSLLVLSKPLHDEAAAFVETYDLWDYREAAVSGHRDLICEAMVSYLGLGAGRAPGSGVNWPEAYQTLWEAIAPDTAPEDRADHLSGFLDGWYDIMVSEAAAQTGTHTQKDPNYVGYWCLEAAAAVVMRGIDDSTFRDHPHYPADFADWARGT